MQGLLGIQVLFRVFVVKDWTENNKTTMKYQRFNKIIIRNCTEYYFERQNEQNKIMHDPIVQKEVLLKWALSLTNKVMERGIIVK